MQVSDVLIEIGCAELPAKPLLRLRDQLSELIQSELLKAQLSFTKVSVYASPRRLAMVVSALAMQQPPQTIAKRGPAIQAAYDAAGKPTKALQGFADACGVGVTDLEVRTTDKGTWLYFTSEQVGKSTRDLLAGFIQTILDKLPMPKRMRWGSGSETFLRPIRWLCVLQGDEAIPLTCYGLTAGRQSSGHRFHDPIPLNIPNAAEYVTTLQAAHVMVDPSQRQHFIMEQANILAHTVGGQAKMDKDLLEEVSGLVEWPVPLLAKFESRFLKVPQEALISAMQGHQKCFPVLDQAQKILPYFITVSNIESSDPGHVIRGNERVMRARLSDAEFFYQMDSQATLESRYEQLKSVIFQVKLGSLHDKAERIAMLSRDLAIDRGMEPHLADRAARLCKVDLLTSMVGEFPELQGIMGYYYALHDQEPEAVAIAIKEHYLPQFSGDICPKTPLGKLIGLADRIDTLVGIFGIHAPPTGDRDPYALRRAALGVLRIIIESELPFDLEDILTKAAFNFNIDLPNQSVVDDCLHFMFERLRSYTYDLGFEPSIFSAVYAVQTTKPTDFYRRMLAVKAFRQEPAAESLIAANKRVSHLLKKVNVSKSFSIDPTLLMESSEQTLVTHMMHKQALIASLLEAQAYKDILNHLSELRQTIDDFFDRVMVMVDDQALRDNRLAILATIRQLFMTVADIALLDGGKE